MPSAPVDLESQMQQANDEALRGLKKYTKDQPNRQPEGVTKDGCYHSFVCRNCHTIKTMDLSPCRTCENSQLEVYSCTFATHAEKRKCDAYFCHIHEIWFAPKSPCVQCFPQLIPNLRAADDTMALAHKSQAQLAALTQDESYDEVIAKAPFLTQSKHLAISYFTPEEIKQL